MQFNFSMTLSVLDENDNTPQFAQQSYTAMVPENSAENIFVANLAAVDEDSGTNADIVYSFVGTGPSSPFSIDNTSGIVSVLRPEALDFEVASSRMFVLQVQAQDRGSPPASSQTVVSCVYHLFYTEGGWGVLRWQMHYSRNLLVIAEAQTRLGDRETKMTEN